ncbi:MAG TPA: DinB family protein [Pyrinomonadaceae bacterium]|nr:DinB family protein [Pyrinomonadaceae bacterium]
MNAELEGLISDARTIAAEARSSFGILSAEQLNWKPSAERWSIAQCFEHLIESNKGYLPIIDDVRKGRKKKSTVWERLPVLPGLAGKLLIKSLDPASTRKLKAPKSFQPSQSNISADVIDDFVSVQDEVIEGMKSTSHLDLEKIVVTSPVASFVAYSMMDAYRIIVIHERRHFQQAERVAAESGFPSV